MFLEIDFYCIFFSYFLVDFVLSSSFSPIPESLPWLSISAIYFSVIILAPKVPNCIIIKCHVIFTNNFDLWIACRVFFGELQSLFASTGFGENQVQVNLFPIIWSINVFFRNISFSLLFVWFHVLCINVPFIILLGKLRIANLRSHYLGIRFLNSTSMNIIRYLQVFFFFFFLPKFSKINFFFFFFFSKIN